MRQQLQEGPDDLKALIRESNKMAKEALEVARKTRRSLLLMQWMGTLKLLLILAPIVAAIIYLPPFILSLNQQFKGLTGGAGLWQNLQSLPSLLGSQAENNLPKNIDPKLLENFLKQK